jgi:hypothetical protein
MFTFIGNNNPIVGIPLSPDLMIPFVDPQIFTISNTSKGKRIIARQTANLYSGFIRFEMKNVIRTGMTFFRVQKINLKVYKVL